jgi:hypothetical protein
MYLDCTDEDLIDHIVETILFLNLTQELTTKIIPNEMCKLIFCVGNYKQLHRIKKIINSYRIEIDHLKTEEVEMTDFTHRQS